MASESTPLVSASGSQPTAYFLDGVHRRKPSDFSYATATGDEVQDNRPRGTAATEFNPRPVSGRNSLPPGKNGRKMRAPSVGGGWLGFIAGTAAPASEIVREDTAVHAGDIGTLVLPRKVPVKVEPKVHFANERTFLAWLHVVVILAAASITIVTYSRDDNVVNKLYGVILLPVSMAFILYALVQYLRRASMIKHHEPGPFIDVVGPTTLTVILMASIIAQFGAKLHSLMNE